MLTLKIFSVNDSMIDIDSESEGFVFCLIEKMYQSGDGVGLQVNDESKRDVIQELCLDIVNAVKKYRGKIEKEG